MEKIHPQFITDTAGKTLVILPANEFDTLLDELEEQEDIRLYMEIKKEDDGERILFSDYLENRKANRA